jgi:hypothetical protein
MEVKVEPLDTIRPVGKATAAVRIEELDFEKRMRAMIS